jgi:hypothetical protein
MKRLFALALFLLPAAMQGQTISALSWASVGASATKLKVDGSGNPLPSAAFTINASGTIAPLVLAWDDINASGQVVSEQKINDAGHVIGSYQTDSPPAQDSYLDSGGTRTILGTSAATDHWAFLTRRSATSTIRTTSPEQVSMRPVMDALSFVIRVAPCTI